MDGKALFDNSNGSLDSLQMMDGENMSDGEPLRDDDQDYDVDHDDDETLLTTSHPPVEVAGAGGVYTAEQVALIRRIPSIKLKCRSIKLSFSRLSRVLLESRETIYYSIDVIGRVSSLSFPRGTIAYTI
jgi:hypothetical protein